MKKAVITLFSISLTAGTLYLAYCEGKLFLIKKLIASWVDETTKQNKDLTTEQASQLRQELDKLSLFEVRQLSVYSTKVLAGVPESELATLTAKLNEKKIREKADLHLVDDLIFGTNI